MNFDDLQSVWRSPHNQPTATELEQHKMKLVTELQRRHRASRGLLWITALPLLFITLMIGKHALWPDPAHTPMNWEREWAVLPFLALPWAGWFMMLRLYRRHQQRHPDYDRTISASVAASLDENRTETYALPGDCWRAAGQHPVAVGYRATAPRGGQSRRRDPAARLRDLAHLRCGDGGLVWLVLLSPVAAEKTPA